MDKSKLKELRDVAQEYIWFLCLYNRTKLDSPMMNAVLLACVADSYQDLITAAGLDSHGLLLADVDWVETLGIDMDELYQDFDKNLEKYVDKMLDAFNRIEKMGTIYILDELLGDL